MIIAPCTVVTGGPEPKVYEDAGVRIAGSHIAQIAGAGDLARAYPDDTWWPARDRVVMPGFVNTHAHLARHLARGLGLRTPGEWRAYDRALSVDDVTCAVTAALVEGLHHGVTTVVDFHRSGACLDLSLSEVMGAADRLGARVATCYGAAEDDTPLERRAAIDESVGFAKEISRRRQGRLRGMLGVQATTLHGIVTLLAEAMEAAGGRDALLVDLALVRDLAGGSDDGANSPPLLDGAPARNLAEAHYRRLFVHGARWAADHFGEELGVLAPGAPADLILLDYRPATEFSNRTLLQHLSTGLLRSSVSGVMVAGHVVMDDGVLTTVDEREVAARARECAARLWKRIA